MDYRCYTYFAVTNNAKYYFVATFDTNYEAYNSITYYTLESRVVRIFDLSYLPPIQIEAFGNFLLVATDMITIYDLETGYSVKFLQENVFPIVRFELNAVGREYELLVYSDVTIYCLHLDAQMSLLSYYSQTFFVYFFRSDCQVVYVADVCAHRLRFIIANHDGTSFLCFENYYYYQLGPSATAVCPAYAQDSSTTTAIAHRIKKSMRRQRNVEISSIFTANTPQTAEFYVVSMFNEVLALQIVADGAIGMAQPVSVKSLGKIATENNASILKIKAISSNELLVLDQTHIYYCTINNDHIDTIVVFSTPPGNVLYNFDSCIIEKNGRSSYWVYVTGDGIVESRYIF